MNNERFAVPEILFHPSDIGIQEMGIPEAITHAVNCLSEGMHLSSSFVNYYYCFRFNEQIWLRH